MKPIKLVLLLAILLAFALMAPAANAVGPPNAGSIDNPKDDHPWGGDQLVSVQAADHPWGGDQPAGTFSATADDSGWGTDQRASSTTDDGGWIDPSLRVWTIFSMLFAGW